MVAGIRDWDEIRKHEGNASTFLLASYPDNQLTEERT